MSVKAQSSFINSPTALRIKVQRPQHYPWSHYHHFSHLLSLTSADPSSQSTHGPLCSSTSPSLPGVHPCPSLCLKHFSLLPFLQILAERSLSPGPFSSTSTLLGQLLLSEQPDLLLNCINLLLFASNPWRWGKPPLQQGHSNICVDYILSFPDKNCVIMARATEEDD